MHNIHPYLHAWISRYIPICTCMHVLLDYCSSICLKYHSLNILEVNTWWIKHLFWIRKVDVVSFWIVALPNSFLLCFSYFRANTWWCKLCRASWRYWTSGWHSQWDQECQHFGPSITGTWYPCCGIMAYSFSRILVSLWQTSINVQSYIICVIV